jgi:hypothetical protein
VLYERGRREFTYLPSATPSFQFTLWTTSGTTAPTVLYVPVVLRLRVESLTWRLSTLRHSQISVCWGQQPSCVIQTGRPREFTYMRPIKLNEVGTKSGCVFLQICIAYKISSERLNSTKNISHQKLYTSYLRAQQVLVASMWCAQCFICVRSDLFACSRS